jgi:hypothetical protein
MARPARLAEEVRLVMAQFRFRGQRRPTVPTEGIIAFE